MTDDELVALEREGWVALSSAGGADYYREHLADGALMAFSSGVIDRRRALEAIESTPPWSRHDITDVQVLRLGQEAAVVVYRVRASRPGQADYEAVVSSTFVREGAAWRLAFHQQSTAG